MADFRSDNTHGASPEIVEAIRRAAGGTVLSYGQDEITLRLRDRCRQLFDHGSLEIYPLMTGTAGNSLTIAAMSPPWGGVFCHEDAHIHRDEMGAPEFFSSGAKLFPISGADGKLEATVVETMIREIGGEGRTARPAVVSLTQATEAGTVYTVDEMTAISESAHRNDCRVHVDGARFANALVTLGATPAEITWRTGVDVLVLGATKNGALAAELLVVFDTTLMNELTTRIHRAGHRVSKMRFLSAQLEAYLSDDLWLRNARHANAMASRLARGLGDIAGVEILRPVEANVVFARLPEHVSSALKDGGFLFYPWVLFGEGAVRLVTGFSTAVEEVDAFVSTAGSAAARSSQA
jgi:threonine aldolase